jgi:tetratricopeptide (TPR) repeat protein
MSDYSAKTCFVIIGYGPKKDHEQGRILDLDKTFENLIKPVFDSLKIKCFRAKDIRHTGVIDVPMYEWIYNADIVVADLSTLNANALYELGVRHAMKPYTTIVISEDKCKYPFDVNHTVIEPYEHLGKDIGVSEANRFKKELKKKIKTIIKANSKDSPVYTYMPNLSPPQLKGEEVIRLKEREKNEPTLSELVEDAENAKNKNEFKIAAELYKICLRFEPNNTFLKQRLALVTYKSKSPNPKQALLNAEKIISELDPNETTDIETLGLSGAINKRLYELTNDLRYLKKSIKYYEKGFYQNEDYYNGINLAFLFNVLSSVSDEEEVSKSYFVQAQLIRERIIRICKELIKDKNFDKREDKNWIYQSLAQAYLGLDKVEMVEKISPKINEYSNGQFDLDTFIEQNEKLIELINK